MRVLLDTCVLSELRHPKGHQGVRRSVDALESEDLFVSVLSLGEITKGVTLLKDSRKKRDLQAWLQALERHYADRVLPVDLETSHVWGELTATSQKAGKIIPAGDGLIAATARRHGLHVMTRNVEHFEPTGVMLLNPWADPGSERRDFERKWKPKRRRCFRRAKPGDSVTEGVSLRDRRGARPSRGASSHRGGGS